MAHKISIKLLHIVESFGGGVYTYLHNLCTVLKARHPELEIVILCSLSQTPEGYAEDFKGLATIEPLEMAKEVSIKQDRQALVNIIKFIKRWQPDVIHCHSSKAGVLGRLAAFWCRVPVCYTPHAYAFLREDISARKRWFYKFIEKVMAKFGGTTIACGKTEFNWAQRFGRAELVRNGIFLNHEPFEKAVPKSPITICNIGRICPQKDFELFCAIAKRFLDRPKVRFIWIGGGESGVASGEVPSNVSITGWVEHDQVSHYLSQATIFLQTSRWEGLSIAILEAMAYGLALVVKDIPSNREVVVSKQVGQLFSDRKVACTIINKLIEAPGKIEQFGAAAREEVEKHYNAEKNYSEYYPIYKKLVSFKGKK